MVKWPTFKWSVVVVGIATMGTVVTSAVSHAQESMAGVGAASSISSSMSGMSASGSMAAGQNARGQMGSMGPGGDMGEGGMGEGDMGSGGPGGMGAIAPPRAEPRNWGPRSSGQAILSELLRARQMPPIPSPVGRRRTPAAQAALARRIKRMTPAQRNRLVMQKYQIRPRNWLRHYLLEDRHKITSGLWSFLTTRTSRYYYRPWSAAMLRADPNHVIGFRSWQDAMLAGYRPDPVSRPEPAGQIADLASLTRSNALARYVEFVYAGQIPPTVFNLNYRYVRQVATVVRSHLHTRHLVGETVDQVLLAAMGEGTVPRTVGGPPPMPATVMTGEGGGSTPQMQQEGQASQSAAMQSAMQSRGRPGMSSSGGSGSPSGGSPSGGLASN